MSVSHIYKGINICLEEEMVGRKNGMVNACEYHRSLLQIPIGVWADKLLKEKSYQKYPLS